MVRNLVERQHSAEARYVEAYGLSTDTKPTTGIVTGSIFIEVDTSTAYFFDEESGDWVKAGGDA